jgi:hypothetical protein
MVTLVDEVLFDPWLMRKPTAEKYPITATLEWANSQPRNGQTAVRKTNVGRLDATENVSADLSLLNEADRDYFIRFLRGGQGSAVGFRAWMPHDHTLTMEAIGTGGGGVTQFKIIKTYYRDGTSSHPDVRRIFKPVVLQAQEQNGFQLKQPRTGNARVVGGYTPNWMDKPFRVFLDAVEQVSGWKVDCKTGILYFTAAPAAGKIVYVDGVFDVAMAFDGNQFTQLFDVNSGAQYAFRELLGPELGLT